MGMLGGCVVLLRDSLDVTAMKWRLNFRSSQTATNTSVVDMVLCGALKVWEGGRRVERARDMIPTVLRTMLMSGDSPPVSPEQSEIVSPMPWSVLLAKDVSVEIARDRSRGDRERSRNI
jgi:hypothetical protein